jgi:pyruvate,water dikinase
MRYVLDLGKVTKVSFNKVGGKNANLGEMLNKGGIRIPPGYAVTTDGYLDFINKVGIVEELYYLLAGTEPADLKALEGVSQKIREMIETSQMPEDIEAEIRESYALLEGTCNITDLPVAVRSSATAEDLPNASFAGQQDTYLWMKGADQVVKAVQKCWSSLFTARAISYRAKNNFPHEQVLISVGVQKMVNAKVSGVMFTINPTNGDPSQIVIEGSWGLGEAVVSGNVTPDNFMVDKIMGDITNQRISFKHIECIPCRDTGGVKEIPISPERQNISCLDKQELRELARIAKQIENYCGCPQDIEWAMDYDYPFPENVFVVQNRPETVWSQKKVEPLLASKSCQDLLMERALKIIRVS